LAGLDSTVDGSISGNAAGPVGAATAGRAIVNIKTRTMKAVLIRCLRVKPVDRWAWFLLTSVSSLLTVSSERRIQSLKT
jgi:hypothetical protein